MVLGKTFDPGIADVGIGDSNIEGVIAHLHLSAFDMRGAQRQSRVVNAVNLDAASALVFCCPLGGRRAALHLKLFSIGDSDLFSLPRLYESLSKGIAGTLEKGRMVHLVIDFIRKL